VPRSRAPKVRCVPIHWGDYEGGSGGGVEGEGEGCEGRDCCEKRVGHLVEGTFVGKHLEGGRGERVDCLGEQGSPEE